MPQITNGTITFEQDYLDWFTEQYGATEWAVYVAGIDEVYTHDKQGSGTDVDGEPFTFETVKDYLLELERRFGPGSPMDLGDPLYAVALRNGVPSFGSHRHMHPTQSPRGSVFRPGSCACGDPWDVEVEQLVESADTEVEWSVFVVGPMANLVAEGQDIDDDEPTGPPFTRKSAEVHATVLNELFARWEAEKPSPPSPVMTAVVLHHGALEPDADVDVEACGPEDYHADCGRRVAECDCRIVAVLADVRAERMRQITKFGEQHRKDGADPMTYGPIAARSRENFQNAEANGGATWHRALNGPFFESVSETDPAALRASLVELAAVACAWIEDLDSRVAGA